MTTERDTHFTGSAELLYLELSDLFAALHAYELLNDHYNADQTRYAIKEFLAHFAYDLAVHTMSHTGERVGMLLGADYLTPAQAVNEYVPDLMEWPAPRSEPLAS